MAQSAPIPVIICGKSEVMGQNIIASLKPEIEVVHFILHSALAGEGGTSLVPPVLAGKTPPPHPESSTIGSGNFSQAPRAVLLGGAFDEELIHSLHQTALADPNARRVPWVRMDKSRPAPPPTDPEYPKLVVQRSKAALIQLERDGKLDGTYSELEYF